MKSLRLLAYCLAMLLGPGLNKMDGQNIPLPEHPRPDFQRSQWINLNGNWDFEFDSMDIGLNKKWFNPGSPFSKNIIVPFPWGSKLSGIKDEADIAWYRHAIRIPAGWKNRKVFLTIGASDWQTTIWLDGKEIGSHQGGYLPFSFDLTPGINHEKDQSLVIRVDDKRRAFTLYGKQGYGNARGLWQTVYLEARGTNSIQQIHCTPDIDKHKVNVAIKMDSPLKKGQTIEVQLQQPKGDTLIKSIWTSESNLMNINIDLPNARLWNLDDPYLYRLRVNTKDDTVSSYFGMRKISVQQLPGTTIPYVALNNQPIYLQLALDQSYHPEGFYTFPSDEFMKREIELSKSIGLNGIRTHIKADIPRKLYWADQLGLLVMSDLPNSWGDPDEAMRQESEVTMKELIDRDYNHPSIFSWVVFNETWGLITHNPENGKTVSAYLPSTQHWVASMYYMVKSLDPTRLVDDNSICCGRGHTETDIYSWHDYKPGWEWADFLTDLTSKNYPGSTYHFEPSFVQGNQPNINAECGNVWGYDGSTGDVDYSFDYHKMMNAFRMFPKMAGWLYTEHHDVINEWNGYWRFDRTNKYPGLNELVPGMSLKDFHSTYYLSTGVDIVRNVTGGETIEVPLYISNFDTKPINGNSLMISYQLDLTDATGTTTRISSDQIKFETQQWEHKKLSPLKLQIPDIKGLGQLSLVLKSMSGDTLHRNFVHFNISSEKNRPGISVISVKPSAFIKQVWDQKQWAVLDGLKENGAGKGYFQYQIPLEKKVDLKKIKNTYLVMELSAKQLFDKDKTNSFNKNQDYMLGSKVSPSSNPNSYPMTDETRFPSSVSIFLNGTKVMSTVLADDPADHRGILSWNSQLKDKKLREAGSYGYLIKVPLTQKILKSSKQKGYLDVKIQSDNGGGIAVYGAQFGRYPVDINLVVER